MTDLRRQVISKVFIHLAGIIMEKLLGKIPPLSHWDININEKGNKYKSSFLSLRPPLKYLRNKQDTLKNVFDKIS